jgi:hypothetical protein
MKTSVYVDGLLPGDFVYKTHNALYVFGGFLVLNVREPPGGSRVHYIITAATRLQGIQHIYDLGMSVFLILRGADVENSN